MRHALFVLVPAVLGFALAALIVAAANIEQFWVAYVVIAVAAGIGREMRWRKLTAAGDVPPHWYT